MVFGAIECPPKITYSGSTRLNLYIGWRFFLLFFYSLLENMGWGQWSNYDNNSANYLSIFFGIICDEIEVERKAMRILITRWRIPPATNKPITGSSEDNQVKLKKRRKDGFIDELSTASFFGAKKKLFPGCFWNESGVADFNIDIVLIRENSDEGRDLDVCVCLFWCINLAALRLLAVHT